jgi:hypothetical protein
LFLFKDVAFQSGTLSGTGLDKTGKVVCTDDLVTVGKPASLRLKEIKRPTNFLANGHDLALVEVEVVDEKGQRCPTALDMVEYKIDGPGEWRGGMAMGPGNYILAKSFPVEGGVNRFLIRSTTTPGTIRISAVAGGLKPAALELKTVAFPVKDGQATMLPSAGLTPVLSKGPTPSTQSYTLTRLPVDVVSATAGANADSAFASYDDNELSDWVNDGQLGTAWVEYSLAREATISEVTLKLNNFRSRTYPLIITVDGKPAFNGLTKTTLGYYTISCTPQKGSKIRIQLAGASATTNASTGVEVNGKKLDDGVARDDAKAKGTLSIIEVEFYESLPGTVK